MTENASPVDRPDLHCPSIDTDLALQGACGQVHLPTGRTCVLAHHHSGSCSFIRRDDLEDALKVDQPNIIHGTISDRSD